MQNIDFQIFNKSKIPILKEALSDLAFLINKNYSLNASLKLVGDRYELVDRQRAAIMRCVSTIQYQNNTSQKELLVSDLQGKDVAIDGFNLLIVLECAYNKLPIFKGLDKCIRDIASVHGTYKSIQETNFSIELIGEKLSQLEVSSVEWVLDSPIAHSGSLRHKIEQISKRNAWRWSVILHKNPDQYLSELTEKVIISSDSLIIEKSKHWCNLSVYLIENFIKEAWIIDLS
ncbi:MAG: DUF434 domain-containing protein [Flammeovirgaceae bacterium]